MARENCRQSWREWERFEGVCRLLVVGVNASASAVTTYEGSWLADKMWQKATITTMRCKRVASGAGRASGAAG